MKLMETTPPGRVLIGSVVSPTLETEGRDVALAAAGDHQAFQRLHRAHQGRVYSLAVRMAGVEWAEDLTQEVFIRVWQKLDSFRGEASFGTWLYRLSVNLILSRREITPERLANELVPLGRAGTPAEMAAVVAFLLSKQSAYITGQVIHADGGTSVQLVPPGFRL